jgi:hypothetical protein
MRTKAAGKFGDGTRQASLTELISMVSHPLVMKQLQGPAAKFIIAHRIAFLTWQAHASPPEQLERYADGRTSRNPAPQHPNPSTRQALVKFI